MSISEKANDLLNKFGSAQFDFMIWNTPDNLVARDKARQEISDYIAELEAAQRWIPVSERLPEKDGYYLVSDDHDGVLSCEFMTERRVEPIWDVAGVLYWMPLPEPPEVEK